MCSLNNLALQESTSSLAEGKIFFPGPTAAQSLVIASSPAAQPMTETTIHHDPPADPVDQPPTRVPCLNCGEPLQGPYCHHCGQKAQVVARFFPVLVLEAFEGLFAFESRTYRALWLLFTRPAFLTSEYLAGRRVTYLPPLRLFLVLALAVLFTLSVELFLDSLGLDIDREDDSAELILIDEEEAGADLDELETGVLELIDLLRLPFLSETTNGEFVALLKERAVNNISSIREDPRDFINQLLDYLPVLLLLMMPLLALMQKLTYLGSGRYYVEHLLLSVHNHSFLFLALILLFVLDLLAWSGFGILSLLAGILESALNLWIVAYLFLSLRRFFAQGFLLTSVKFVVISLSYGALLISATLLLSLVSFFIY